MLDIRLPIGVMFMMLGALLVGYGITTDPSVYRICLGHNLNLIWGSMMALFGVVMIGWMRLKPQSEHSNAGELSKTVPADSTSKTS